MKIVIIGNGKIGSNLAALLVQEGHDITVVDCDETHLRKSRTHWTLCASRATGQRRKPSWKPEQTKPPCSSRNAL